jgi:hypothetical protein
MKLVLASVPDDTAELAGWLEHQIAGPDLGRLIDELTAVHGTDNVRADLQAVLGHYQSQVLEKGLGELSEKRLRALLRYPKLLAELQDAVIAAGSPYWDALFDQPGLTSIVGRARMSLDSTVTTPTVRPVRAPIYRHPLLVSLATAAAVLIAVYIVQRPSTQSDDWGWNKPGILTAAQTRGDHLNGLASAADEWKNRPRNTPDELRQSLQEMRDGCTKVLAAKHEPLTLDDRAWLVERCVAWGTKLDKHLADLQTGRSIEEVRREADETVDKLAQALRARAST